MDFIVGSHIQGAYLDALHGYMKTVQLSGKTSREARRALKKLGAYIAVKSDLDNRFFSGRRCSHLPSPYYAQNPIVATSRPFNHEKN